MYANERAAAPHENSHIGSSLCNYRRNISECVIDRSSTDLCMCDFISTIFVQKNVYRIRFQKIKIRPLRGFKKRAFFSLLLMRKRLSGGQKWFLKPYFPLIRGMFVFKSGLRFLFRALEVPEPRVRKRPLSPTNRAFSSLSVRALPVPETKI